MLVTTHLLGGEVYNPIDLHHVREGAGGDLGREVPWGEPLDCQRGILSRGSRVKDCKRMKNINNKVTVYDDVDHATLIARLRSLQHDS